MEENKNTTTETTSTESSNTTEEANNTGTTTTQAKTLDDYLKDPSIQSEFDKKLESAKAKWEKKWQEKAQADKTEAERLAKMTEEEKQQEIVNKALSAQKQAEAELNAYKLKEEAQKIASEKGLDISLLNIIDYSNETASTVKTKIDDIDTAFKKAVEKGINEKLRQAGPKTVVNATKDDVSNYLDQKYKNNPYYRSK